jgi:hypothetical protein
VGVLTEPGFAASLVAATPLTVRPRRTRSSLHATPSTLSSPAHAGRDERRRAPGLCATVPAFYLQPLVESGVGCDPGAKVVLTVPTLRPVGAA